MWPASPSSRQRFVAPYTLSTISFSKICVPAVEIWFCTFPISFWIVLKWFSCSSSGLPPDMLASFFADTTRADRGAEAAAVDSVW